MTTKLAKIALLAAIGFIFSFNASNASAQFSKAVVLMKGTVHMDQTGKAYSTKISIRSAENQSVELTASTSNSETGDYLVILQPSTKYVIHIEGQDIATVDEAIETPAANSTIKLTKDFTVSGASSISTTQDKASLK
ncbi:MAG: hypothetical protein ACHQM6_03165 [Candidatus Kapaibacterium sp.]